jgi:hypothetical protein
MVDSSLDVCDDQQHRVKFQLSYQNKFYKSFISELYFRMYSKIMLSSIFILDRYNPRNMQ